MAARYRDLRAPIREVGAAIDSAVFHPGRTAHQHLDVMAIAAGIPGRARVEVLSVVGLAEAGDRRVGGFSMGMRQRLALAGALLGDPPVLLLDEPLNGLDPDGIAWVRVTLRRLAAEGRTVLLSSHVLAEVATTVDDVVVIERGRLIAAMPLAELAANHKTVVRTPHAAALTTALIASGHAATRTADDEVTVADVAADVVGSIAAQVGVTVFGLAEHHDDLEQIFHQLTLHAGGNRMNRLIRSEIRKLTTMRWFKITDGDHPPDGPGVHAVTVFAAKTGPGVGDDEFVHGCSASAPSHRW